MPKAADALTKAHIWHHEKNLAWYRMLLGLGAVLYPAWWFIFRFSVPDGRDPLLDRFLVGGLCALVLVLTYSSDFTRRHLNTVFLACAWIIMAHVYYLLYLNLDNRHYIVHVFVAAFTISCCLPTRRHMLLYSVGTFAVGAAMSLLIRDFSRLIFVMGLGTGLFVSYIAIASRIKLVETLVQSEQRFRTMAEAAPVMIWTADVNGFCDFFNQVWLAFTGCSMDESAGTGWTKSLHPEDLNVYLETFFSAFRSRKDFRAEFRMKRADAVWRQIYCHGIPSYKPSGEFAGYIGSCIDVTELKSAAPAA
jgi:PAS domain S-box-containing protein